MELLDAKFKVKGPSCRLDMVFRNRILDEKGRTKEKLVKMAFIKGMPMDDFTAGLRALADHIDNEVKPSLFQKKLKVVTGNE